MTQKQMEDLKIFAENNNLSRVDTYLIVPGFTPVLYDVMVHKNWGRLGIYTAIPNSPHYAHDDHNPISQCSVDGLAKYFYRGFEENEMLTEVDRIILGTTLPKSYVSIHQFSDLTRAFMLFHSFPVIRHQMRTFMKAVADYNTVKLGIAWEYINDPVSVPMQDSSYVSPLENPDCNILEEDYLEILDYVSADNY